MDVNVENLLDKIREMAGKTGEAAGLAADAAGKKASELINSAKTNLKIFDLNAECEVLFKEIGRMVYDIHQGAEVLNDAMDAKIAELDDKQKEIFSLKQELERGRFTVICPGCGKACTPEDAFCSGCGSRL